MLTVTADALPTDEDEFWVHELIGAAVQDPTGAALGTVIAVEANPASDLLVLDGDRLIPLVFVVSHAPGSGGRRSARRALGVVVRIDVFTIFPEYLEGSARTFADRPGARTSGRSNCDCTTRATTPADRHRTVDDSPFGGGPGMVMTPEPLFAAVEAVDPPRPLLLLAASGRRFDQAMARELAASPGFSLVCGRYEGVDQRVADHLCDGELSIGDVVLAGGEAAALVVIEAVTRLVPGVMGNDASAVEESFSGDPLDYRLLEYPHYTRPAEFRGWPVPEVLRSGDHERVARWRRAMALRRTLDRRPDLLPGGRAPARPLGSGPARRVLESGPVGLASPLPQICPKD